MVCAEPTKPSPRAPARGWSSHHHGHLQDGRALFGIQGAISVQADALVFGKPFHLVSFRPAACARITHASTPSAPAMRPRLSSVSVVHEPLSICADSPGWPAALGQDFLPDPAKFPNPSYRASKPQALLRNLRTGSTGFLSHGSCFVLGCGCDQCIGTSCTTSALGEVLYSTPYRILALMSLHACR